jgi:predicted dehydrogenase
MTKRGIIIGFGRAGKRHGKILDELGIEWAFYDPDVSQTERAVTVIVPDKDEEKRLATALEHYHCSFAVICTPPDLHLRQIRQCLDAGLPVLCEKPLCDLGQLAEAEALLEHPKASKVMIGFNYRWHPKLRTPNGLPEMLVCRQQRNNLPDWGLLLDHCSHDLDIMRSQVGGQLTITSASHNRREGFEWWDIVGTAQGQDISIEEWVGPSKQRVAKLAFSDHIVDIDADPMMYKAMWEAFLRGEYEPGLGEAIETQRLLERCAELANGL